MAKLKISDDPEIAVKQMARELANNSIVNKALARYIEQILEAVSEDTIQPLRDRISQQDAELERLRREVEELRDAKWQVKHVDTMNDIASLRIALEGAEAALAEARKAAFIEAAEIATATGTAAENDWPGETWIAYRIAEALRRKAEETRT